MKNVDALAEELEAVLSEARESLGLPEVEWSSPEEMLADAARISELVAGRMRTIEEQLGGLDATRAAAHGYLAGQATLADR